MKDAGLTEAGLLALYDRVAEAEDAIPRLRRLVLDLAVRGKLVPQDEGDEPASVLLARIATEKAQLAKEGRVKTLSGETVSAQSVHLPSGWLTVSLETVILRHLGGGTPSKTNFDYWGGNIRWASVKDVGKTKFIDDTIDRITEAGLQNSSSNLIPAGNLIVVTRMGLGQLSINRVDVAINQDLRALFLSRNVAIDYVYNFFLTQSIEGTGLTVKGIKLEELLAMPFPLPPLAEQHRIVAKVEALMALLDRLEAAQAAREETRTRLTAATLSRLTEAEADTLTAARFALQTLPALTTHEVQIKTLRQTILNLAVRGKLVEQDAHDEPPAVLLKRIADDIRQFASSHRLRTSITSNSLSSVDPYPLPENWTWATLSALCRVITDGDHQPPPRSEDGVAFLTIGNVTTGRLVFDDCRRVPHEYFEGLASYRVPRKGDLLYTVVGATFGRPVIVDTDEPFCVQRHVAIIKPSEHLSLPYLHGALSSPFVYEQASKSTTGTAQPTIALAPLRQFAIPLPPLAEQHRIVAKVEELMSLCDRLETALREAAITRARLLDATLREALAGAQEAA